MTNLLIVDDHQMFLEGLQSMLEKEGGFDISLANNAAQVFEAFKAKNFHIVIMDIQMPDSTLNGIELTKKLVEENPDLSVLIVSMNKDSVANVEELIAVGARGYVIKDSGYKELYLAIKRLEKGEEHWDPQVLQLLVDIRRNKSDKKEGTAKMVDIILTNREKDVLKHLILGMSSKEIAESLYIGTSTVDTHRKNLLAKFGAKNTTEVVVKAQQMGLI